MFKYLDLLFPPNIEILHKAFRDAIDFFNKLSPLRVDTESLAVKLCLKVVQIAKAASIPELCTSIGVRVIVPPDNIVPTWSRVETLNTISN